MQQQVSALGRSDATDPTKRQEALEEAIQALRITIEELRVTNEMLNLQNEELALMHRTVEAERNRYQSLFQALPIAFLVSNRSGEIKEANRAACQVFGLAAEQLKRYPLVEYVSEEARPEFRSLLERLHEGKRSENLGITFRPRVRKPFLASVWVSVAAMENGTPDAFQWLIREVKERGVTSSE